jgi:hypothetical protein
MSYVRRVAAFCLGALSFPVYVILVSPFNMRPDVSHYYRWLVKVYPESVEYLISEAETVAAAIVLSLAVSVIFSARSAAWWLAGFIATALVWDFRFLEIYSRGMNYTVWAPLLGVGLGWVLGRYLNRKRRISDATAAGA